MAPVLLLLSEPSSLILEPPLVWVGYEAELDDDTRDTVEGRMLAFVVLVTLSVVSGLGVASGLPIQKDGQYKPDKPMKRGGTDGRRRWPHYRCTFCLQDSEERLYRVRSLNCRTCRVNISMTHRDVVECPSRDRGSRRDVIGIPLKRFSKLRPSNVC